ncbi:MAG: hypothetical protein J0I42_20215 [Bosea sp.]|uniref:hypothetical protein n=1 Tax=Bosea sp. (in: a-proteobacteria) TaxID=1871050 RepID=UPI001AD447B2|nr:hypothetical protein [Bosea sp. (in: a-proteobacteria)]MBN9454268.1 hypothetical protein [Bosea sp. (in: a-proteobacteria)]
MISVDTFDTWLRAGFIPGPHIERGQIVRWHWPSLERHLINDGPSHEPDPFLEGVKNLKKKRDLPAGRVEPSRWPLPSSAGDHLDRWYSKLGFDPHTMTDADMERLQEEAFDRWKSEFIFTRLGKRERDVLRQFQGIQPGSLVRPAGIKGLGVDTEQRLEARGFIATRYRDNDANLLEGWELTEAGNQAVQAVLAGQEPDRPAR